jgi:uncharacterized protein involved in exopolysaccharide biosynthesis
MVVMSSSSPSQHSQDTINEDDETSLLDLLGVIAENLRLLIIGPIVAGLIGLAYAYTLPPIFTATTTIMPPAQSSSGGGAAALLGQLGGLAPGGIAGIKTQADEYLAFLASNNLSDQLIDQFKLMEYYDAKYHEQAREILKRNSNITPIKKTNLIAIEISDKDPQLAANLANAYVTALSQMLGKMALEDAKYRRQLLEQQINEATEKSYRSPVVREVMITSAVREYEAALVDQKKDRPFIQQVDKAEVPNLKSKPKRAQIAIIFALIASFGLLLFVFIRNAYLNAKEGPETKVRVQNIIAALRRQLPW